MSFVDDIDADVESEMAGEVTGQDAIEAIAPDAISLNEAQETETVWRILVWGNPGLGKTHFAYTMPEPVCFIDTERKADNIAHKFDKQLHLWKPSNYDEAQEALGQAIDLLEHYKSETGNRGTIVIDSMSVMWGWSQQKYVDEYYPNTSFEEARENFSTGFGSGQSDWKKIKDFHNERFRARMLDTEFNLCWTAMREDDYEAIMQDDLRQADKPAGEKENPYKATDIIRIAEGGNGKPGGILQKSALIKHRYVGLEYPTFEKHRKVTRAIEEQEIQGTPTEEIPRTIPFDVRVVEGRPVFEED